MKFLHCWLIMNCIYKENERISGEITRGDMFAFLSRKEEDNEKV